MDFWSNTEVLLRQLPFWQYLPGIYLFLKVTFIILDVVLLGIFIFAFKKAWALRPHLEISAAPKKEKVGIVKEAFLRRWNRIVERKKEGSLDSLRIAIIEADALIDDYLKQSGLEGEHMADRMAGLDPAEHPALENLWRAHRLRNDLVHTSGFFVSVDEAVNNLNYYESFLKEVKIID